MLSRARTWDVLGRRCAAYTTDIVMLFLVLAPTSFALQRLFRISLQSETEIWRAALISFSVPSWSYFILGDHARSGMTFGKQLWRVRVVDRWGHPLSLGRAVARTAIKLLPWEVAHLVFVIGTHDSAISATWLIIASNLLAILYLASAVVTYGRRSIHDFGAGTMVVPATSQAVGGIWGTDE